MFFLFVGDFVSPDFSCADAFDLVGYYQIPPEKRTQRFSLSSSPVKSCQWLFLVSLKGGR